MPCHRQYWRIYRGPNFLAAERLLADGRGGRGRSRIIGPQESLAIYKSFNTRRDKISLRLCTIVVPVSMLKNPGKSKTEKPVRFPDGPLWSKKQTKNRLFFYSLKYGNIQWAEAELRTKCWQYSISGESSYLAETVTWDFLPRLFLLSPLGYGGPIREQKWTNYFITIVGSMKDK